MAVLAYVAVLKLYARPFSHDDLILMVLAFTIGFPAEVPFRRFSTGVAGHLLGNWLKVVCGVCFFWAAKLYLRDNFRTEPAVVMYWLLTAPGILLLLHMASPRIAPLFWPLYAKRRVVVVGVTSVALRMAQLIEDREAEGQHFVGYFEDRSTERLDAPGPLPLLGRIDSVAEYVKKHAIDVIYISLPMSRGARVHGLLDSLRDTTASVCFVPDIFIHDLTQVSVTMIAGLPLVSVCDPPFVGTTARVRPRVPTLERERGSS
ncbi:Rossmann-fold NAD(P)-binding domain-containing protein [Caenimonas soli]|uniref:hypothetical protein n=1 Tax=Caenimonas soli TaxID=2735555 RepID=UPI00155779C0|nr:hypothetical protein [Caenimonas soli]NPC57478.1 hypothetical protein [Caenimonas soli]